VNGYPENELGKKRLQLTATTAQIVVRKLFFTWLNLLGAVAVAVVIAVYDSLQVPIMLPIGALYVLLILILLGIPVLLLIVHPYKQAIIYDLGIVLQRGSKTIEIQFDDIVRIAADSKGVDIITGSAEVGLNKYIFPRGLSSFHEELETAYTEHSRKKRQGDKELTL